MKRFFKPIEKENSPSKKPFLCNSKPEQEQAPPPHDHLHQPQSSDPVKFLTWNANSLLLRVKNNWTDFSNFVRDLDPHLIAIQEVRMPAAGTKGAPKNPGKLKDDMSSSREEKQGLMRATSSPHFANYHVWWSLVDTKYARTALLVKKHLQPKMSSVLLMDQFQSMNQMSGMQTGYIPPNKEVRGQPGFTLSERQRFSTILTEYRGKRMRIDYFIVSEKLKDQIATCKMHGHGIELEGFYGSDHCPLSLELLPESSESTPC